MLRVSLRIACAAALLGCATDPRSDTTDEDTNGSSSESGASESSESGESESDESESESDASESGDTDGPAGCGCAEGEFCDFPDDLCGAGEPGTCEPIPGCVKFHGLDADTKCGCDGLSYWHDCVSTDGRVDINSDATSCEPWPGYFPCGDRLCNSTYKYCERQVSDVVGEPDSYACLPLPFNCGDFVDCSCFENEACGSICEPQWPGFMLTCPGG